jgi:hypothetical protein
MKLYKLEKLVKGKPQVVLFGDKEWGNHVDIGLFLWAQMEANPLTPYRKVGSDGVADRWQTEQATNENGMLNCKHTMGVAVGGYASCNNCGWSELSAYYGMYKIDELN